MTRTLRLKGVMIGMVRPSWISAGFLLSALVAFATPSTAEARQEVPDTVRVAFLRDWPPHYYFAEGAPPTGFAADVVEAVAARADLSLRFVSFPSFLEAVAALEAGEVDVIPDFGALPGRRFFGFTRPFSTFQISVFRRASDSQLERLSDLGGRRVGVVRANAAAGLVADQYPDAELVVFETEREALLELLSGSVDAAAYPGEVLWAIARAADLDGRIRELPGSLDEVDRAMAVRAGDTALLTRLEAGLDELVGSREYQDIYARWFSGPDGFWTVGRVAAVGGILLVAVLVFMAAWHYLSVARLASELQESLQRSAASEVALRSSETRFRTLFDTAYEGIVLGDASGRIDFVNARARDLLGRTEGELRGQSWVSYLAAPDRERVASDLEGLAPEGHQTYETELERPDGSRLAVLISAAPVRPASGDRPDAVVCTITDITARVDAERARHAIEERLAQGQRLEALGRLAGGIAHDFNNLLTIVRAHSDLLLLDAEASDRGESAEEVYAIREASDRGAALTRQLLAFSRDQVLSPRTLDPNKVVASLSRLVDRTLGDHIQVERSLCPNPPPIEVDPGQLDQAMLNLCVNAGDAMPEGGTLTLTTSVTVLGPEDVGGAGEIEPGTYVCLSVSDTGVGIDDDDLAKIFEPFFTTKGMDRGTGLGLAMVYGLVTQSGGTIRVSSDPGLGSEFTLLFPAKDGAYVEDEARSSPLRADLSGRVLIVEDNPGVRRAVRRILTQTDLEVELVADGAAGLDALRGADTPFDVLVTDLMMPGMSGIELIHLARAFQPGLSLVAMSGYAPGASDFSEGLPRDVLFLAKPFAAADLVNLIGRALGRDRED